MMSSLVQPKLRRSSAAVCLAAGSLPDIKTEWPPGMSPGFTITSALIVLSVFTTRASGNARWMRSPRLSVLELRMAGGNPAEKSSALEISTSTLPARFAAPAASSASSEPMPYVALTTISPKAAASVIVPARALPPAAVAHPTAFSLPACREPIVTSWPKSTSLVPIV